MQDNKGITLRKKIHAVLPVGSFHGWGVCGKYLIRELSRIAEVSLLTDKVNYEDLCDQLDFRFLSEKAISPEDYSSIKNTPDVTLQGSVIQSIVGNSLIPLLPNVRGGFNLGYTFFEENILSDEIIKNGRRYFDIIATGSSWNERVLRQYGLGHIATVIQGIDPVIFNPLYPDKEYLQDFFVLFSGGKFELRKGQDIVIRAYKHLQDKYSDVMLINCWFNHWAESTNTMSASPHIRFTPSTEPFDTVIARTLIENGIDTSRVITLPFTPNIMMPRIYKNTDAALFPNRCEGGTNLVMMEYMACGKPVIASYNTGHEDILTDKNSIKINSMRALTIFKGSKAVAEWYEPSLDETIHCLEQAYLNRHALRPIGAQAGRDMSRNTWKRSALGFYELLK